MSSGLNLNTVSEVFLDCNNKAKGDNGAGTSSTRPASSSDSRRTQSPPIPSQPPTSPRMSAGEDDEKDEIVPIENVTVKFRLNANQVIARVYPNCMTLDEVKTDLGRRFEVQAELLELTQGPYPLSNECQISQTCCDDFGIHEFELELKQAKIPKKPTDSESEGDQRFQTELDLEIYYNKQRLPDFITVYIPAEESRNGQPKNIVVEIQNKAIVKPFICGYMDKATGTEYLDAFSQTGPFINKCKFETYACRDTQTFELKVKHVDTTHDQTAQCWLDGTNVRYYSDATDYNITPRKYVTYAQQERKDNKMGKILLIQRNFRRYKWMKWMQECAAEFRRLLANRLAEEIAFNQLKETRLKREERAKQFPRSRDDFDLLYGEVEKWKLAELKRISKLFVGAARVAEVHTILDKEIQLLNGIERQRQLVNAAMKDFRQEQLLKKMGEPIKWVGYRDTIVHMDLLRTQRVRFLTEVFHDIQQPLAIPERLELITKVREILLNEEDFPEFGELFDLFDRERNLLVYAKHCDVEVLRKRQNILFMELIKFDREPKEHDQGNRMCLVCQQVKPYGQFAIRTRQFQVDTCKKCYYLKVASTESVVYTAILRSIQRDERKKHCSSSFAFIMQVDDIRHIIDQIWHGHSILNKCQDIQRLRLPRWDKSEEWAPWNCICLTDTEARDHKRVVDLEKIYDLKTRLEIFNRHMLARHAFRNLAAVSVEFTETGKWWNVGLSQQRNIRLEDITSKKDVGKGKKSKQNELNYKIGKLL